MRRLLLLVWLLALSVMERPPRDPDTYSEAEKLALSGHWRDVLGDRTDAEMRALHFDWEFWRRPAQVAPRGGWRAWYARAGRGFGKTRTGAENVRRRVKRGRSRFIGLIAPTAGDARDVMIEGESGLLAVTPKEDRPHYEPSKRRLTWPNGATGSTFSADEPERLRGPQHDLVWFDEPASARFGKQAFDNAILGLRLGTDPRMIITGTPKPLAWLREEAERPSMVTTTGSTYQNLAHLAETFIRDVLDRYEGTRLGKQELHAEWLDDVEGALWAKETIERHRLHTIPPGIGRRVVIGVDPPGATAECGIVAVLGPAIPHRDAHAYVLEDASLAGPPEVWAAQAISLYHRTGAESLRVESNYGGDMVRAVIHQIDPDVRVEKVNATGSKGDRAEPVSTLYVRGRVHHVGYFGVLESQLVTWVPTETKSPDRLDALVHAVATVLPPIHVGRATATSVADRRLP